MGRAPRRDPGRWRRRRACRWTGWWGNRRRLHPVAGLRAADDLPSSAFTYRDGRAAGMTHATAGTAIGLTAGWLAERTGGAAGVAAAVAVASAGTMLGASARAVGDALGRR